MISSSAAFGAAVQSDSRTFSAKILYEGTEVECDIINIQPVKGACDEQAFALGSVFSSSVEITVSNLATPLENAEVALQIGVKLEDDSFDYITYGTYTIIKVRETAYQTELIGAGVISVKFGLPTPAFSAAPTVQALANAVQTATGVSVSFVDIPSSLLTATFRKAVPAMASRSALNLIAFAVGGFATENATGGVEIHPLTSAAPVKTVLPEQCLSAPVIAGDLFTMTGIKVIVSEETEDEEGRVIPEVSYQSGSPIRQTYENEYISEAQFNLLASQVVGLSFMPASIDHSLGDPRLEPWDWVKLQDILGNEYNVPCHVLTGMFDGGFSYSIIGVGESETDAIVAGPITEAINNLTAEMISAQMAIINRATIAQLNAAIASIDTGYINKAIIGDAEVTDLTATKAEITRLLVNTFTSEQIQTILLDFDQATGGSLTLDNLEADKAAFESLLATDFTASQIEAISAVFSEVATTSLVTESLTTKYAKIDFANIGVETVSELFVNTGFLTNATIQDGKITGTLGAVQVTADLIEVNTIVAGDLLVQSQDDPNTYYRINLEESQITREDIPADQMVQYLSGNDIIAHSITTREITAENLQGTGGWINLAEGTFRYTNAEAGTGLSWDGSQFQILSGQGTGTMPVVASYIDDEATEFGSAWLTDAEGTTLTPAAGTVYLIQTEGDYYGQFFLWSGTEYQTYDVYGQGVTSGSLIGAVGDASTAVQKTSSMTYENGVLSLGGYGAFKITIGNLGPDSQPRLSFWQGDVEVAYINNNEMYIKQTIVLEAMDIGDWRWKKQQNGNLTLQWIGG